MKQNEHTLGPRIQTSKEKKSDDVQGWLLVRFVHNEKLKMSSHEQEIV